MSKIKHNEKRKNDVALAVLRLLVRMDANNDEATEAIKYCNDYIKINVMAEEMKMRKSI